MSTSFMSCVVIAAGGALGSLARYLLSLWALPLDPVLPWGTIITNVLGCTVIGFVGTFTLASGRYPIPENARLFLMVGFCGGFTTFSAFSLQTLELLRAGAITRAFINVAASVILCVAAVGIGHWVAARLNDNAVQIAQIDIEEDA